MNPSDAEISFIRTQDVVALTGLSRSQILKLEKQGQFPAKIKVSERAAAWVRGDVINWMRERITASSRI